MALSNSDIVRLKVGDTDMTDAILTDEEIGVFLTTHTADGLVSLNAAAADAAQAIAAKFARGYNFSTDGQAFNRSERVAHYQAVARELRATASGGAGSVIVVKSPVATAHEDALNLGE